MELGNLVSLLAHRRDLDRSRPVGVHEGLAESKVLDVLLVDLLVRLVERHVEVGWLDASNSGLLWNEEEVVALVVSVLDEIGVDDRAGLRVDCLF